MRSLSCTTDFALASSSATAWGARSAQVTMTQRRVILAFSGAAGAPYEAIRERGYHLSLGEREAEVSSVAAPVFSTNWRLLGSMCISGPSSRLTRARLEKHAKAVVRAANQLS